MELKLSHSTGALPLNLPFHISFSFSLSASLSLPLSLYLLIQRPPTSHRLPPLWSSLPQPNVLNVISHRRPTALPSSPTDDPPPSLSLHPPPATHPHPFISPSLSSSTGDPLPSLSLHPPLATHTHLFIDCPLLLELPLASHRLTHKRISRLRPTTLPLDSTPTGISPPFLSSPIGDPPPSLSLHPSLTQGQLVTHGRKIQREGAIDEGIGVGCRRGMKGGRWVAGGG